MCNYFHSPLLIVDHKIKPNNLQYNKTILPKITHYKIAINENVARSWGIENFDKIIETDITNSKNIDLWKEKINHISNQTFKVNQ